MQHLFLRNLKSIFKIKFKRNFYKKHKKFTILDVYISHPF